MSEVVTVEIPDDLAQRARALAAVRHLRLEEAVLDWISRAVAEPPIETLNDEQLLSLCDATLDAAQQEDLTDLLTRHREGQLTDAERSQLDQRMRTYRQGLILKAQALKEAVARGLRPPLTDNGA